MELALWPGVDQSWHDLVDGVVHADGTGWHGVVVEDHFMADGDGFGPVESPRFESMSVLAALAVATERVRLAPLVASATFRHPAVLANIAVTIDHLSAGRFTLGLGAGWQVNEHQQYGIELGPRGARLRRLEEQLIIVRSLLDRPVTSFAGEFVTLTDARCEPKPIQAHLPIMVGGKGDRMMGVVARHADEWNMWAMPDVFAERGALLDRRCEAIGRDPATIGRSTQALVHLTDDPGAARAFVERAAPRPAFAGSPAQFAELVAQWHAVGVDRVIVPDWSLGVGARRTDALDAVRAAVADAGLLSPAP